MAKPDAEVVGQLLPSDREGQYLGTIKQYPTEGTALGALKGKKHGEAPQQLLLENQS